MCHIFLIFMMAYKKGDVLNTCNRMGQDSHACSNGFRVSRAAVIIASIIGVLVQTCEYWDRCWVNV
jgi:hypothetical protein